MPCSVRSRIAVSRTLGSGRCPPLAETRTTAATRSGARRAISSAHDPPTEFPTSTSGPAAAASSTRARPRLERVTEPVERRRDRARHVHRHRAVPHAPVERQRVQEDEVHRGSTPATRAAAVRSVPEPAGTTGNPAATHASNPPSRSVAADRPRSRSDAGREARRVALLAHDDDALRRVAKFGDALRPVRVEAPLEHVAGNHDRAGNLAARSALLDRARVDHERAVGERACGFVGRRRAGNASTRGREELGCSHRDRTLVNTSTGSLREALVREPLRRGVLRVELLVTS